VENFVLQLWQYNT